MSAATMILFVSVAPDIFTLFSFGKYLPTHILTYLYQAENNHIEFCNFCYNCYCFISCSNNCF
jgi:hypothetical protein